MPHMNKLSSYKTTVSADDGGKMQVHYWKTAIVTWDDKAITLRNNGFKTVTTKRKMNQASNQFDLGFGVRQQDYVWFVDLPSGETVKFEDGMTFEREKAA